MGKNSLEYFKENFTKEKIVNKFQCNKIEMYLSIFLISLIFSNLHVTYINFTGIIFIK